MVTAMLSEKGGAGRTRPETLEGRSHVKPRRPRHDFPRHQTCQFLAASRMHRRWTAQVLRRSRGWQVAVSRMERLAPTSRNDPDQTGEAEPPIEG